MSTYGLRHYLVKFSFKLVSKHLLFLVLNSLVSIAIFLGGEKLIDLRYSYLLSIVYFEIISIIFYYFYSLSINKQYQFYKIPYSSFLLFLSLVSSNSLFLLIILLINLIEISIRYRTNIFKKLTVQKYEK